MVRQLSHGLPISLIGVKIDTHRKQRTTQRLWRRKRRRLGNQSRGKEWEREIGQSARLKTSYWRYAPCEEAVKQYLEAAFGGEYMSHHRCSSNSDLSTNAPSSTTCSPSRRPSSAFICCPFESPSFTSRASN